MADADDRFALHDTALIVRVPEAEPIVRRWRLEYDTSAALGVPAHVTVLFPWKPGPSIDSSDLERLSELCRRVRPFDAMFSEVERRDDVVWMRPDPEDPFRSLTSAVWEQWPRFPPYRGKYENVIPHLTIADGDVDGVAREIQEAVARHLPITTRVAEVELIAFQASRWGTREVFQIGT